MLCLAGLLTLSCATDSMRHGLRTPPVDPTRGWYFEVKYGDSLDTIAQAAGQPVSVIAEQNKLTNPATLFEGMLLWVPPKQQRMPATVAKADSAKLNATVKKAEAVALNPGVSGPKPMRIEGATVASYGVRKNVARASDADKVSFRWPVDPGLCKPVSTKRGLDLVAEMGTPVAAARGGEIIYSGTLRGHGNTVLIDHGDGFTTVYAHLQKSVVKQGQDVKKGQTIGNVGSTEAEKNKLYFEIRKGKKAEPVEPMQYLPGM